MNTSCCITGQREPVDPARACDTTNSAKNSAGTFARGHSENCWRPALRRLLCPAPLVFPDEPPAPRVGECTAGLSTALGWLENEAEGGPNACQAASQARIRATQMYQAFVRDSWALVPESDKHSPYDPSLPNVNYPWAVPVDLVKHRRIPGWPKKLFADHALAMIAAGYFHGGRYPLLSRHPFDLLNELWALWALHVPSKYLGQLDRAPFWSPKPEDFPRAVEALVNLHTFEMREDCHAPAGLYALAVLIMLQFTALRRLGILFPDHPLWGQLWRVLPLPNWVATRAFTRTPDKARRILWLPFAAKYQPHLQAVLPMVPEHRPFWHKLPSVDLSTNARYFAGLPRDVPPPWAQLRLVCEGRVGKRCAAEVEILRQAALMDEFRRSNRKTSALRAEWRKEVRS